MTPALQMPPPARGKVIHRAREWCWSIAEGSSGADIPWIACYAYVQTKKISISQTDCPNLILTTL